MGTHPIFESDFDCLTEMMIIISLCLFTIESKLIMFAPNMGRYGNQLDQYVSMIYLADRIERQIILGPLIHYKHHDIELIDFDSVFNVSRLG